MPTYKVIETGFIDSRLRHPGETITTDKSFPKCPSWLEPVEELSPQQKAAKTKRENKELKERKAAKKSDIDTIEGEKISFADSPGAASKVETLS